MRNSTFSGSSPFISIIQQTISNKEGASSFLENIKLKDGIIQSFYQTAGFAPFHQIKMSSLEFQNIQIRQSLITFEENLYLGGLESKMDIEVSNLSISSTNMLQKSVAGSAISIIKMDLSKDSGTVPNVTIKNVSISESHFVDSIFIWINGEFQRIQVDDFKVKNLVNDIGFRILDGTGRSKEVLISNLDIQNSQNIQFVSTNINMDGAHWKLKNISGTRIKNLNFELIDLSSFSLGETRFIMKASKLDQITLFKTSMFQLSFKDNVNVLTIFSDISLSNIQAISELPSIINIVRPFCCSALGFIW